MDTHKRLLLTVAFICSICLVGMSTLYAAKAKMVWLDDLDISQAGSGWGTTQKNKSVEGNTLTIAGETFEHGIGTHAEGQFWLDLDGWTSHFTAKVGVDDEVHDSRASVEFQIFNADKLIWKSGVMKYGDPAKEVDIVIRGVKKLGLIVTDAGDGIDYDHADWANAQLRVTGKDPAALSIKSVEPYILTPKPSPKPRINGARIFGVRPGSPFLYTIPATGDRPMSFSVYNLPAGLVVDGNTGRITGKLTREGEYKVTFIAENELGKDTRDFRIVVGEKISLTPPMGWNSWNCWAGAVDAEKVKSSAKAMVDSGLINHGWTYINIDDTWQAPRGGKFHAILGNEKFPDMEGLCDYVHGLGLKIGIYSTPWITSYAGYIGGSSKNEDGKWTPEENGARGYGQDGNWSHGQYSFAVNDAKQWADWGFDYLKYDWNPNDVFHVQEMALALRDSGRDIVYSLSNSAPFNHADDWARLSNCWRTTGDIVDTWGSMAAIGFAQDRWAPFAGPGHWNDPDMLVVGKVGWGPALHPTRLLPDEQYTHISLWSLLSAPLLIGCDLADMDDFTISLLSNDEVIDINQDPLGQQARQIYSENNFDIWAKDMEDGSKAVGLFNRSMLLIEDKQYTVTWDQLGIEGNWRIRDVWRQADQGESDKSYSVGIPPHGVVLVRLYPVK